MNSIKSVSDYINAINIFIFKEYNYKIKASAKEQILKELNYLYINDYSIYPDFQGMSEIIKKRKGLFNVV